MISNFLSHFKNSLLSKKYKIEFKKSKKIIKFLNILIKEGFIKTFVISNDKIYIYLKYKNNQKIIKNIKQISKPGKRFYIKNKQIYNLNNGLYIISTSFGFINQFEAKKYNCGGELICRII